MALGLHLWAIGLLVYFFLVGCTIPSSFGLPRWVGLAFPLAALVLTFTFARSVWLTERQRGVIWRETHYDLDELRRAHHHFIREVAPIASPGLSHILRARIGDWVRASRPGCSR